MTTTIVSWNVNSIRLRVSGIRKLVKQFAPDVICLQETKVADDNFPTAPFLKLGYRHVALNGQKAYHGVAILSRLPLEGIERRQWCGKADARHLRAVLPDGLEIHNFYVPAGGDVPDPAANEKFAHKLAFMDDMTRWFARRRKAMDRTVLLGDLNVAPKQNDVWSHRQLLKVVSHTPVETEAMARMYRSANWVDAVRKFVPEDEKLFTWWSYRSPDWAKADKGRRLDHIWVSPALADDVRKACVIKRARGWRQPSDHAPVLVEIATPHDDRLGRPSRRFNPGEPHDR